MINQNKKNIFWIKPEIKREDRNELLGFNNKVLWLTGLSGSGKTTIAKELQKYFHNKGILTYILDGDNIRHGLNSDLGFSDFDRQENIRRISEVAKLFFDAGIMTIITFISPFRKQRDYARKLIGKDFIEIYVKCNIEECKKRDPKGLYKKALNGEIKDFTGIDSKYEEPENANIILNSENEKIDDELKKIVDYIKL